MHRVWREHVRLACLPRLRVWLHVEGDVALGKVEEGAHLAHVPAPRRLVRDCEFGGAKLLRDAKPVDELHETVPSPAHEALQENLATMRPCSSFPILHEFGNICQRIFKV